MVEDLFFLNACLDPSLVHNTPVHKVPLAARNFLPHLQVIAVLKDHVVCLVIAADHSPPILNKLPFDPLNKFFRRFIAAIMVGVFNDRKRLVVKNICFENVLLLLSLFNFYFY
jgi:hypothetical protein